MGKPQVVETHEDLTKLIGNSVLSVLHFKADMFPACLRVSKLLEEMSDDGNLSDVSFAEVTAEAVQAFCEKHKVIQVPTVLYFRSSKCIDRVEGYKTADIRAKINFHAKNLNMDEQKPVTVGTASPSVPLEERLKELIGKQKVMLFMKGNREVPRCGFSKKVVAMLNELGIEFGTFDILEDEEIRQGLKTFSNWQTYPQLYSNGELVGGHDIIVELYESGELVSNCQ